MFRNYVKMFLRNFWKHLGYSISNISSLAVGMTSCFLIFLFVRYETNWNQYNTNYQKTYRVQQKVLFKNNVEIDGQTGYRLASELKNQIPEIENACTIGFTWSEYLSTSDKLTFSEKQGCYADSNLFKVLTFEFVRGNPQTALSEPFSVVLTEEMANKYFPGENAFGKIIKSSKNKSLKVTGIIKNLPYDLDFRPSYIVSLSTYKETTGWKDYDKLENIGSSIFFTIVTLKPNVSLKSVNDKIYNFTDKYVPNNIKKIYLKPLSELHLTADERNDIEIALYYISGFAVFVLILACINSINLSTANSFLRKKEIGIRKVIGASRAVLFTQFIGESLLFAFLATLIAAVLVIALLPAFNTVVQRHMQIELAKDYKFILYMLSAFLVTGFLSGVYPAIYLSGFQPVHVIKGNLSLSKKTKTGSSKGFLRKTLVTVQFCISISLLVGTTYVINQVHYMKNKDLGFAKKDLMIARVFGNLNDGKFESLRNELMQNPNIEDAAFSNNAPFHGNWEKEINWEGATTLDKIGINYNLIDYNFINTYKMKMELGRNFSRQFSTDTSACIINETARKALRWKNPLGKKIDNNRYTIIGVVKDFHQYSVHEKIPPYYMVLNSGNLKEGGVFAIRINSINKENTIADITRQFRQFFPEAIIEVTTFDNDIDIGTKGVWEIVEKVFIMFAIIAVLLAANGLFGMISFSTQRRIKEVGVRKVFGAKSYQLYITMSKELFWIFIFSVIAGIQAGYFVSRTTPGAYKYQMNVTDYLLCIGMIVFTAFAASVYHTTKAVMANPVDTLRYE